MWVSYATKLHDWHDGSEWREWLQIRHLGKQGLLRQFGYNPRSFHATAQALQENQMFTGDGGKIHDDSGASDGVVEQMVIPGVQAVW